MAKNYYEILGINKDASSDEIKKATSSLVSDILLNQPQYDESANIVWMIAEGTIFK